MRTLTYFVGPDTGDTLVKAGETFLKSIFVSWKDFTADQIVLTIVDGEDITGTDKLAIYANAENNTISHTFAGEGLELQLGLFVNKSAASGKAMVTIQYR